MLRPFSLVSNRSVRRSPRRVGAVVERLEAARIFFERSSRAATTLAFAISLCVGCGTTKFSDTGRTATEQLLISSAMEDVVDEYDYSSLSGLKVFLKIANSATDSDYLKSLLRQQLAANGVFIKDSEEKADYVLEVAPGTVGTNRYELMYGIPETTIPAIGTITSATSIPEFALIKRTDQKAQVKLMMWAYNKTTGAIVWQSGVKTKSSKIRDRWIFGAGPFTEASYDNALIRLGGDEVLPTTIGERISNNEKPSVRSEAVYRELDAQAIERLEKIRTEGLAKALEEASQDAEKLETEDGTENANGAENANGTANGAETPESAPLLIVAPTSENSPTSDASPTSGAPKTSTAPTPQNLNSVPSNVQPNDASNVKSRLVLEPAVDSTPVTSPVPPPAADDDLQLDFGESAPLRLRSVYVPSETRRY